MEQQEVKATSIFLSAAVVVPWRMVHSSTKLTVKKMWKKHRKTWVSKTCEFNGIDNCRDARSFPSDTVFFFCTKKEKQIGRGQERKRLKKTRKQLRKQGRKEGGNEGSKYKAHWARGFCRTSARIMPVGKMMTCADVITFFFSKRNLRQ